MGDADDVLQLHAAMEALEEDVAAKDAELDVLQAEVTRLSNVQADLDRTSRELALLQAEQMNARAKADDSARELAEMGVALTKITGERDDAVQQLASVTQENDKLKREAAKREKELASLQKDVRKWKDKVPALEADVKAFKAEAKQAKKEKEAQHKKLTKELQAAQKGDNVEERVAILEEVINGLQADLEAQYVDNLTMQQVHAAEIRAAAKTKVVLEGLLDRLSDAEIAAAEDEIGELHYKGKEAKKQLMLEKERLRALTTQVERLKRTGGGGGGGSGGGGGGGTGGGEKRGGDAWMDDLDDVMENDVELLQDIIFNLEETAKSKDEQLAMLNKQLGALAAKTSVLSGDEESAVKKSAKGAENPEMAALRKRLEFVTEKLLKREKYVKIVTIKNETYEAHVQVYRELIERLSSLTSVSNAKTQLELLPQMLKTVEAELGRNEERFADLNENIARLDGEIDALDATKPKGLEFGPANSEEELEMARAQNEALQNLNAKLAEAMMLRDKENNQMVRKLELVEEHGVLTNTQINEINSVLEHVGDDTVEVTHGVLARLVASSEELAGQVDQLESNLDTLADATERAEGALRDAKMSDLERQVSVKDGMGQRLAVRTTRLSDHAEEKEAQLNIANIKLQVRNDQHAAYLGFVEEVRAGNGAAALETLDDELAACGERMHNVEALEHKFKQAWRERQEERAEESEELLAQLRALDLPQDVFLTPAERRAELQRAIEHTADYDDKAARLEALEKEAEELREALETKERWLEEAQHEQRVLTARKEEHEQKLAAQKKSMQSTTGQVRELELQLEELREELERDTEKRHQAELELEKAQRKARNLQEQLFAGGGSGDGGAGAGAGGRGGDGKPLPQSVAQLNSLSDRLRAELRDLKQGKSVVSDAVQLDLDTVLDESGGHYHLHTSLEGEMERTDAKLTSLADKLNKMAWMSHADDEGDMQLRDFFLERPSTLDAGTSPPARPGTFAGSPAGTPVGGSGDGGGGMPGATRAVARVDASMLNMLNRKIKRLQEELAEKRNEIAHLRHHGGAMEAVDLDAPSAVDANGMGGGGAGGEEVELGLLRAKVSFLEQEQKKSAQLRFLLKKKIAFYEDEVKLHHSIRKRVLEMKRVRSDAAKVGSIVSAVEKEFSQADSKLKQLNSHVSKAAKEAKQLGKRADALGGEFWQKKLDDVVSEAHRLAAEADVLKKEKAEVAQELLLARAQVDTMSEKERLSNVYRDRTEWLDRIRRTAKGAEAAHVLRIIEKEMLMRDQQTKEYEAGVRRVEETVQASYAMLMQNYRLVQADSVRMEKELAEARRALMANSAFARDNAEKLEDANRQAIVLERLQRELDSMRERVSVAEDARRELEMEVGTLRRRLASATTDMHATETELELMVGLLHSKQEYEKAKAQESRKQSKKRLEALTYEVAGGTLSIDQLYTEVQRMNIPEAEWPSYIRERVRQMA